MSPNRLHFMLYDLTDLDVKFMQKHTVSKEMNDMRHNDHFTLIITLFQYCWKPKSKPKLKFDSSHSPSAVELFFKCINTFERHMIKTHDII